MDSNFKCSGDNNAFIYPDFKTVLLGSMQGDKIVKAYDNRSNIEVDLDSGYIMEPRIHSMGKDAEETAGGDV